MKLANANVWHSCTNKACIPMSLWRTYYVLKRAMRQESLIGLTKQKPKTQTVAVFETAYYTSSEY